MGIDFIRQKSDRLRQSMVLLGPAGRDRDLLPPPPWFIDVRRQTIGNGRQAPEGRLRSETVDQREGDRLERYELLVLGGPRSDLPVVRIVIAARVVVITRRVVGICLMVGPDVRPIFSGIALG